MIVSNENNVKYLIWTATMLFELVIEIKNELNIDIEFINLGWGIWTPYQEWENKINYKILAEGIKKEYIKNKISNLSIVMECGRTITWPYWYLVTKAIHTKNTYKQYIWTDASMSNLMRPWIYGAYHHISVLWKEIKENKKTYDIVWSLCENNDKFAIDRELPEINIWDFLIIHDTWAHGHAMWFQYNGKLRSAELLLKPNNSIEKIRRAETIDDYFITLDM
jgi:diaminopimelate decarboxylase